MLCNSFFYLKSMNDAVSVSVVFDRWILSRRCSYNFVLSRLTEFKLVAAAGEDIRRDFDSDKDVFMGPKK